MSQNVKHLPQISNYVANCKIQYALLKLKYATKITQYRAANAYVFVAETRGNIHPHPNPGWKKPACCFLPNLNKTLDCDTS